MNPKTKTKPTAEQPEARTYRCLKCGKTTRGAFPGQVCTNEKCKAVNSVIRVTRTRG